MAKTGEISFSRGYSDYLLKGMLQKCPLAYASCPLMDKELILSSKKYVFTAFVAYFFILARHLLYIYKNNLLR